MAAAGPSNTLVITYAGTRGADTLQLADPAEIRAYLARRGVREGIIRQLLASGRAADGETNYRLTRTGA